MKPRRLGLVLAAALGAQACGGGAPPPPPQPAPGPVAAPRPPAPKSPGGFAEPQPGPAIPPIPYEARDRRDPFVAIQPPAAGKTGLQVASVRLVGVLRGRQQPLALVEAPDGVGYILKTGDTLGDGRVAEIGADSVSFQVAARPGERASTVTLRLRTD
jgi:type IV pilus assembly protein PilP